MKISQKIVLVINFIVITAICMLNYVYQSNGFDFKLKLTCSALFSTLGLINLAYAIITRKSNFKFYLIMFAGLVLAFLGDYFIGFDFVLGAGSFALGHICFVIAYCFIEKIGKLDFVFSAVLFVSAASFLLFAPFLSFDQELFRIVCLVYALIISTMLGKAIGNFVKNKNTVTLTLLVGSFLFFFSDLMLVLAWFIGGLKWANNACMGTYYPALCLLALSMCIKSSLKNK